MPTRVLRGAAVALVRPAPADRRQQRALGRDAPFNGYVGYRWNREFPARAGRVISLNRRTGRIEQPSSIESGRYLSCALDRHQIDLPVPHAGLGNDGVGEFHDGVDVAAQDQRFHRCHAVDGRMGG